MRGRRAIFVVWGCFTLRLLFYCAVMPLWEGYDEWAHFAVVRHIVSGKGPLVSRERPIPRDVEASFELAPVPWEMRRDVSPPAYTEDGYWSLRSEERDRRVRELGRLPAEWADSDGSGRFSTYEALQPPLYYWIMAPILWLCQVAGAGLTGQVLALRFASALLASLIVPLVYLVALPVWNRRSIALGCAGIVALMPGLALDVARVGNDCLAVALFTLLTVLLLRTAGQAPTRRLAWATGIVLGLGLLTKAYFLTAIPAVVLVWAFCSRKSGKWGEAVVATILPFLVAGWWYLHNVRTTGTLSGLSEAVMLRGMNAAEMVHGAAGIAWLRAIDAIFFSHLYFGGWSSLTVRSWMYHLFYVGIVAGAAGLPGCLKRRPVQVLLILYICFWLGQLYNVALLSLSKGLAGSMGWYMYAVVAAEVILCVAGLLRWAPAQVQAWTTPTGGAMFALFDLYTLHAVAIPYYTGMLRHRPNGSLEALHLASLRSVGLTGALHRLTLLAPAPLLLILWLLYLSGISFIVYLLLESRRFPDA